MLKANPQMLAWGLIGDATLTDELLTEVLARVRVFCPDLSESEVDGLRRELEATIGVTMSEGVALRDQVWPPWLDDKRASINWRYWGAFKNQPGQRKSQQRCGNGCWIRTPTTFWITAEIPVRKRLGGFAGLVMGDVQSGKTSNYTSLINKAADVGYQIIVILTGMIEDLRQQTQERLDIGFIAEKATIYYEAIRIGSPSAWGGLGMKCVRMSDLDGFGFFNCERGYVRGDTAGQCEAAVLLVIKKNKSSLTHLIGYLEGQRPGTQLDIPCSWSMTSRTTPLSTRVAMKARR